jgi:hypothetical protein
MNTELVHKNGSSYEVRLSRLFKTAACVCQVVGFESGNGVAAKIAAADVPFCQFALL